MIVAARSLPDGAERAWARFGTVVARGVVEQVDVLAQPQRLVEGGFWVVVGEFEGAVRAWRFDRVEHGPEAGESVEPGAWRGPRAQDWSSSMSQARYRSAVSAVRDRIREGEVYQANICRVLAAPLHTRAEPDAAALAAVLARGNPAPWAGAVHVPAGSGVDPVWVVSASPELFLRVDGPHIASAPIKGTATDPAGLQGKDEAENVMITDLVRNDLQRVCLPGTVGVDRLLERQQHPGLVHLVSTVSGRLAPQVLDAEDRWRRILTATFPPGSVAGAPKSAALDLITELEPEPRGVYCGTVGWVDADAGTAALAVGIRTFTWSAVDRTLRFGTGAGITWGSDPQQEWEETELKARRLVALASRTC